MARHLRQCCEACSALAMSFSSSSSLQRSDLQQDMTSRSSSLLYGNSKLALNFYATYTTAHARTARARVSLAFGRLVVSTHPLNIRWYCGPEG